MNTDYTLIILEDHKKSKKNIEVQCELTVSLDHIYFTKDLIDPRTLQPYKDRFKVFIKEIGACTTIGSKSKFDKLRSKVLQEGVQVKGFDYKGKK